MRNPILIALGYLLIAVGAFWTCSAFMAAFFDWMWWVPVRNYSRESAIVLFHVIGGFGGFGAGITLLCDQYSRAPKR